MKRKNWVSLLVALFMLSILGSESLSRASDEITDQLDIIDRRAQSNSVNFVQGLEFAAQGKFNEAKGEFQKVLITDQFYLNAEIALEMIQDEAENKIEKEAQYKYFKYSLKKSDTKIDFV